MLNRLTLRRYGSVAVIDSADSFSHLVFRALGSPPRLSFNEFLASNASSRTEAVCLIGPPHRLLGFDRAKDVVGGKGIFHLGEGQGGPFCQLGAKAVIGYRNAPAFLLDRGERLPREAFSAPIAIAKGHTFRDSFEIQRRGWSKEIALDKDHDSIHRRMARLIARVNLKALYIAGDEHWRISQASRFVWLDSFPSESEHPQEPQIAVPKIEVVGVTSEVISWLREDPRRLSRMSPERFEDFVFDRLVAMGFSASKIGRTFQRDGGIDIIAVPLQAAVPFLLAVQVKHSRVGRNVGPEPVRSLQGVLATQPIDIGMVVTNTSFTPDARWVAERVPHLTRLRDFDDLKLWINDQFEGERAWREMPRVIEIAPGMRIPIPQRFD